MLLLRALLGTSALSIVIDDIDRGIKCTHSKFENDTKVTDAVDTAKRQDLVQRDLDKKDLSKLEQQTHEKFMILDVLNSKSQNIKRKEGTNKKNVCECFVVIRKKGMYDYLDAEYVRKYKDLF